ncbi:MAG: glycosyltransferase [Candidatus Binatia bacterium]|nr:glycosyltransferase [Candidatus Binatia bacterium]
MNTSPPDLSPPHPECAVVVASFRPGPLIDRCLAALLAQQGIDRPEIVVVDSSGDGTAERLQRDFPGVTVIALPQQTHQALARNIGVAHTRAPFVAITDQDCIVPPDWLTRLLAWHRQGDYAAVGGAIGNGTPDSVIGTAMYLSEFNEYLPGGEARVVSMIPHCNICFRREVFRTVGPFVAVPPGAEDLVYNFLLAQRGYRFLYDPNIVVTHCNRTALSAYLQHQRVLGFGSAIGRRIVPLPGHILTRYPRLAYVLPLVRLGRTAARLFVRHRSAFICYLLLLPIVLPGYIVWTAGFLAGLRAALPPLEHRLAGGDSRFAPE